MPEETEYDEDGFPIYRPDPEVVADVQRRMEKPVDCRALALRMQAERGAPNPALIADLRQSQGLDATKTLTEIEGIDLGDAFDVADEATTHALRHVPIGQWTAADLHLMLVYRQGVDVALPMALRLVGLDPLTEAAHYRGDLLVTVCQLAANGRYADQARRLTDAAEQVVWAELDRTAAAPGADTTALASARRRVRNGGRAPDGRNPLRRVENDFNVIARARDAVEPPVILASARSKQTYAKYRQWRSVELVPLPDFDDPAHRAVLEAPDTFQFRRDTLFTLVEDRKGEGVRLRIEAEAAIDHRHGALFPTMAEAKGAALTDYGITHADWVDGEI